MRACASTCACVYVCVCVCTCACLEQEQKRSCVCAHQLILPGIEGRGAQVQVPQIGQLLNVLKVRRDIGAAIAPEAQVS